MGEIIVASRAIPAVRRLPERPIVVVLGGPRSGAPLCAGVLGLLGVGIHGGYDDALGRVQDDVLALFGRGLADPLHDYPMPPGWWVDGRLGPLVERLTNTLADHVALEPLPGLANPCLPKLVPVWTRVFAALGLTPSFVVCLDDPAGVAHALQGAAGLDGIAGEFRALDYAIDALRYTSAAPRLLLRNEASWHDPVSLVARLRALVGGGVPVQTNDFEVALAALLHRHEEDRAPSSRTARQPLVRHFFELAYQLADSDGDDAGLTARLRSFTDNYIAFRQLLAPFEARHRAAADAPTCAGRGTVTRATAAAEADHLRALLADRDQACARLGRELGEERDARRAMEQDLASALNMRDEGEASRRRLEQASEQTEVARVALAAALDRSRAAQRDAETRAARLEERLHNHSVALSDALAALSRAEETQRLLQSRTRALSETAERAEAEAARCQAERDAALQHPDPPRRWWRSSPPLHAGR